MGTLQRTSVVEVDVDATPEQVWALLTDLGRAAEWSHENKGGDWLGDVDAPVPGARFRGRNRQGRARWARECEVLVADEPSVLSWRTVPTRRYRDSTIWTYELEPTERGCRIRQRYEVVKLGPVMERVLYAIMPAHRDRSAALAEDLRRLGAVAGGRVPLATG